MSDSNVVVSADEVVDVYGNGIVVGCVDTVRRRPDARSLSIVAGHDAVAVDHHIHVQNDDHAGATP